MFCRGQFFYSASINLFLSLLSGTFFNLRHRFANTVQSHKPVDLNQICTLLIRLVYFIILFPVFILVLLSHLC